MQASAQPSLFDTDFSFQVCAVTQKQARPAAVKTAAVAQADLFASVAGTQQLIQAVRSKIDELMAAGDRVFSLDELADALPTYDRLAVARSMSRMAGVGDYHLLGDGWYAPATMDFIEAENTKDELIEDAQFRAERIGQESTDSMVSKAITAQRSGLMAAWF